MTRTHSMIFVAAALALAACGGSKRAPLAPGFKDGALWSCQISDYDAQPCKLTKGDGGWRLVKLLGSQRFEGTLARVDAGTLSFAGQFFCPWGACDVEMAVDFKTDGPNESYVTSFEGDQIYLRYDEALESEWGGAGYGGLTGREVE